MALPEIELALANETLNSSVPYHIELNNEFITAGAIKNGHAGAMAGAAGKSSAVKSVGAFSGSLMKGLGLGGASAGLGTVAPALISITAITAVGYVLYKVNDRLMKKLTSY